MSGDKTKTKTMTKEIKNKLQSQKLEITHLLSMQLIESLAKPDEGKLNSLHKLGKLNNELLKLVQDASN
tara:strand:- start:17 stop:223 length:207 start_codon:yes stop_codon:yes gene_type:complete